MRRRNKVVSIILCVCFLFLAGCQSEQDSQYSQAEEGSAAGASSGDISSKLVILSAYGDENVQLKGLVEEFEALHPEVDIVLEEGISSADMGNGKAWDQFAEEVTTQLMSGDGPDILVDPGTFTMQDYLDSGLVYNLREWMEEDPDFSFSDYYENIFEAFEIENQQFTLPFNFILTQFI